MSGKSKDKKNSTSPKGVIAEVYDTQVETVQQYTKREGAVVSANKTESSVDGVASPVLQATAMKKSEVAQSSQIRQDVSVINSHTEKTSQNKKGSSAENSSSEDSFVISYVPPIKFPRILGMKLPKEGLGSYTLNAELSVADKAKRRSLTTRILFWLWFALLLVVTIIPYWYGRRLAILHTDEVLDILQFFSLRGIAFLSWLLMTLLIVALWFSVVPLTRWIRRVMAFTSLALLGCLQFIAGFSLLKSDFWYATYVVYHSFSNFANAVNVGIFCSGLAFFAFIFAYLVISLVVKKKTLPSKQRINILASTKGILSFTIFLSLQICFICALLFGSFLFQSLR